MKILARALWLGAFVLALGVTIPTAAHAEYRSSIPANGAAIATAPPQILITFSQETSATQSRGQVTDAHGDTVSSGPAVVDLNDRTKMIIPLRPGLPDGVYTVHYTSQSADTHVVDGSFIFTIAPPAPKPNAPWRPLALACTGVTLVAVAGLVLVRRQARAIEQEPNA